MTITAHDISPTIPTHVVLLVHGIRDLGGWQGRAQEVIEKANRSFKVVKVRFHYYDVISFLAPNGKSDKAYDALLSAYQSVKEVYPEAKISIVAHSFGTYLVGRLLQENPETSLHRIILCGSVLPEQFNWSEVIDRIGVGLSKNDNKVLNECGNQDIWPVLASAALSRYGAAGRNGFNNDFYAVSRWKNGGHSCFFNREHYGNVWYPFLEKGVLPSGNAKQPDATMLERVIATVPFLGTATFMALSVILLTMKFWWLLLIVLVFTIAGGISVFSGFGNKERSNLSMNRAIQQICTASDETERDERVAEIKGKLVKWTGKVVRAELFGDKPYLVLLEDLSTQPALGQCKWSIHVEFVGSFDKAKEFVDQIVEFEGEVVDVIPEGNVNTVRIQAKKPVWRKQS